VWTWRWSPRRANATSTTWTYVHIDLGVLDPAEFSSVCYGEPDGVPSSVLAHLIAQLDNVVGAAITEHAPIADNPAAAEVIRRIGAALDR
jgi:arginase